MKQPIKFLGLSFNRDEHSVQNGELCVCGNAELHDGTLRPSVINGTYIGSSSTALGGDLLYVHKTASYTNFIYPALNNGTMTLWHATVGSNNTYTDRQPFFFPQGSVFDLQSIEKIQAVGNTLLIIDRYGLHYCIFKEDTYAVKKYIYIGQRPPFPQIQFNLVGASIPGVLNTDTYTVNCNEDILTSLGGRFKVNENVRSSVTEQVMSEINHRISTITENGYFYAPFLIRWCYRLYDGSMFMHSSPVLMFPLLQHPVTTILETTPVEGLQLLDYHIFTVITQLKWRCLNDMSAIDNWRDIIKSVDFFISPQFSPINTAELIKEVEQTIGGTFNLAEDEGIIGGMYQTYITGRLQNTYSNLNSLYSFILPENTENSIFSRIQNESSFYKLASVEAASWNFGSWKNVDFSPDTLKNITAQKAMDDDYRSSNILYPSDMYVYNSRMHLYGLSEHLQLSQPFSLLFPYCYSTDAGSVREVSYDAYGNPATKVVYKTEDGEMVIRMAKEASSQGIPEYYLATKGAYLFIPDSRASSIQVSLNNSSYNGYQIDLSESALLEGSVCFRDKIPTTINSLKSNKGGIISLPNKIYVSAVNNPFYFPLEGINTVGVGKVIGLATVTTAISQGQYGLHDLIVFCSDGIWTLAVNSQTGLYSGVHTLSREICTNPASICQLDQSVLFASKRGLCRVFESSVASVSDMLDGPLPVFSTSNDAKSLLPGLLPQFADNAKWSDNTTSEDEVVYQLLSFSTKPLAFFQNGSLLYDFAGERVIVLPADTSHQSVAYVLSLRDMTWSTMIVDAIGKAINSYPHPYLQLSNGSVMCLDKTFDNKVLPIDPVNDMATSVIVVTRTLTFDTVMKVIQGFEQIHNNDAYLSYKGPVLFIYGSNDNIKWRKLGYSAQSVASYLPGYPYRFFRLALYMQLRPSERYSSVILDIIEKYQKL